MKKNKKMPKGLKVALITLGTVFGVVIGGAACYVGYAGCAYYRIEDNLKLDVRQVSAKKVELNKELTYTSFNIGFGAYNDDFSFFMDSGIEEDGTYVKGKYTRAFSKEVAVNNTKGCIEAVKKLDSDFIAFQEVDPDGDRSQHVPQDKMIEESFLSYDESFAQNYHQIHLIYPLFHFPTIGAATSGIQTLSKYKVESSLRKQYVVSDAFFDKMFDLDRCFQISYLNIAGSAKQLILINSHMSAYDKGGTIRDQQLKQLNDFMMSEYNKGNYVVCGGDFNHDLLTFNPLYDNYNMTTKIPFRDTFNQQIPDWYCCLYKENKTCGLDAKLRVFASENEPTYRGCDGPYRKGITYVSTLDGFVVTPNIEVLKTETTKTPNDKVDMFAFSDHQPTTLTFKLKA